MVLSETNKQVQKLTLNLLMVFIDICKKNDLRYYFTGGALIGVLRHRGFIPWDDDVDIGMPRTDFDRFHVLMKTEMPEGYGLVTRYNDPEWHFDMSQFIDLESEIVIHLAEKPRKAHIWIDVFPLDGLPDNKIKRWAKVKYILMHRYLVQIANMDIQVDAHRRRPVYEKITLSIFKTVPVGKLINTNKVLDHLEKILREDDFDTSEYVGNMLGRYREKEVVPRKYFGNPVKGTFEGIEVNIPEMSDALERALYGDYMRLPPEKDRVAHNVTIIKARKI